MAYQLTPFLPLYAFVFCIAVSMAVYATFRYLRDDRREAVLAFALLMLSISVWELNTMLLEMVTSRELKLIAQNIANVISVPFYLFSLLVFALAFAEHGRWFKWAVLVAASTVGGLGVLLLFDPEFLYGSRGLVTRGPVTILGFTFEEYVLHDRTLNRSFRLYAIYSYFITLLSAGILVRYIVTKSDELYTEQSLFIAVGIGTPLFLNGTVSFGILPPDLNVTDIGFGVSALCFAVAIFRYRLFELPPIGRQQLVSVIDDPLVVVNAQHEIVHSNPAARQLFDVEPGWKGMDETEFFESHAERLQPFHADATIRDDTVEIDGPERYFNVNRTTIQTSTGEDSGWLIVLREVTELKTTNQRLDQFASMVSHDLRTPLNTALFQTNRLARERSDERTEAIQEALDRMDTIIDDTLQLARAGETFETTEECSLGDLVAEVWESEQMAGTELDCRVGDTSVDADPVRLIQLVENLLRNALDHNDSPLTVRVGTFAESGDRATADTLTGFYIEDDGRGVPTGDRDEIFEHGYTTNQDGNGYGLSIVQYIVDAHGWEIRVTDGPDGGARFEITGIDTD